MDSFKEFLGKDLDDCIGQALQYYDCPRENLEVEIVQDAKSGIFGIVGARKAKIRARRARLAETFASLLGSEEKDARSGARYRKTARTTGENASMREMVQSTDEREKPENREVAQPGANREKKRPEPARAAKTWERPEQSGQPRENIHAAQPQDNIQAAQLREKPDHVAQTREKSGAPMPDLEKGENRALLAGKKPPRKGAAYEKGAPGSTPADAAAKTESAAQEPKMLEFAQTRPPAKVSPERAPKKTSPQKPQQVAKISQRHGRSLQTAAANCEGHVSDGLDSDDLDSSAWPLRPVEELDQALLAEKTLEIVSALLTPIAGRETAMRMETCRGGARVHVDWEGDAGLLIGREGQTLAAVQYLASRMLSRALTTALRVQVDIGNYRARQDDKLRELAKTLAERARQAGRPFSTRPLSSYHRRVIHLFLQDYEDIQTRSIGDGPQKRVLIAPRRSCPQ